jgi:hypothetical protein
MPTDEEQLLSLLEEAGAHDRVCPTPSKWHDFYKLIGSPRDLQPLILSGWAFSTDREKRERFQEQIRYAASTGKLGRATAFVKALAESEWHSNEGGDLDWSYGDTNRAEIEQRERAVSRARDLRARLISLAGDEAAFGAELLAETLFEYELLLAPGNNAALVDSLRRSLAHFSSLTSECEVSFLDDVSASVQSVLHDLHRAKQVELLLLEIIGCVREAGMSMDRESIGEFVADIFDDAPAAEG